VILLDEVSLGLVPLLIEEIFGMVKRLRDERNLTVVASRAERGTCTRHGRSQLRHEDGRIVLEGRPRDVAREFRYQRVLLVLTEVGARKSFRDLKHYKRRKRRLS
jgi:branched-chain amino acid transport system ATP-binding protein